MRSLTKSFRTRAAIFIALAYAFCVLAPTVAVALVAGPASFHCLGELETMSAPAAHESTAHSHAGASDHHHDQGTTADHDSDTGGKAPVGSCCGLFCVSAIAHDPSLMFGISAPASAPVPAVANGLAGRAPGPLHSPPIA